MSGDQPQRNGTDPVENGANGSEDVEMEEDTAGGPTPSIPTSREHDGDQMTVVVPPAKGARLSGQDNKKDKEDDVAMEGSDEKDADEPEIDPRVKAVQGRSRQIAISVVIEQGANLCGLQISRIISVFLSVP
jgi:26S proteasome regulatory subunit N3